MRSIVLLLAVALLSAGCSESAPASNSAGPSGDAGACATDQDCALCCNTANKNENEIAIGYVLRECACKGPEVVCAASCTAPGNDVCSGAGAAPSKACSDCIDGELGSPGSACVAAATATCEGDETCTALVHCLRGCP